MDHERADSTTTTWSSYRFFLRNRVSKKEKEKQQGRSHVAGLRSWQLDSRGYLRGYRSDHQESKRRMSFDKSSCVSGLRAHAEVMKIRWKTRESTAPPPVYRLVSERIFSFPLFHLDEQDWKKEDVSQKLGRRNRTRREIGIKREREKKNCQIGLGERLLIELRLNSRHHFIHFTAVSIGRFPLTSFRPRAGSVYSYKTKRKS